MIGQTLGSYKAVRRSRSWCFGLSLLLALALFAGRAGAQEDEAQRLYQEGKRHYDIGEYDQAIESWKKAYLIQNPALLLFNIAQAYRLKGDCGQAMRFYRNYLREDPDPPNHEDVNAAMALCAGKEGTLPPDATRPDATPPDALPPDATPPGRDEAQPRSRRKLIGWITAGSGVALAAVGVGFGLSARSKWAESEDMCVDLVCTPEGHDLADEAGAQADVATVLVGVGLAAVAAGVVIVLTAPGQPARADRPPTTSTRVRVAPTMAADGAGLMIVGRF